MSLLPRWMPVAIGLTAVLALVSISYRYRVEQRNRAVTIAAEFETVETLSAAQGLTVTEGLANLKQQGLGAVVLSEEIGADLVNEGKLLIIPEGGNVSSDGGRFLRGAQLRFPGRLVPLDPNLDSTSFQSGGLGSAALRGIAVGLDPDQARSARQSGLEIVARLANPPGSSAAYVRGSLEWAHGLGATVFLPMGDQVLGRREALDTLTDSLESLGMRYASPEFTKLGGDANVLQKIPERVIRLHAAQAAELDKLPYPEAIDRYSRAARERGMRMLLVRPVSFSADRPLSRFAEFVRDINRDIVRQGGAIGPARPFDDSGVPRWLALLLGLSIVPTAYAVGAAFVRGRDWRLAGLALLILVGAVGATRAGKEYTALVAAIAFPTAAFLVLEARRKPHPVVDFFLVSGISLVGGLAVAGLLNGLPYFIRAEQFTGVKLAVFLPILLVAGFYLYRLTDLRDLLRNPMTWGAAGLAIVVLGALLFMNSRTGNEGAGVSDFELKLRFLLDQILLVRPRTKEFLIGHPMLVVGIGMLAARRSGDGRVNAAGSAVATALVIAGGAIGQTSIVNTMCHIHTPVALSLMRVGVGLVSGCIIGLAVWAIARRWLARPPRAET